MCLGPGRGTDCPLGNSEEGREPQQESLWQHHRLWVALWHGQTSAAGVLLNINSFYLWLVKWDLVQHDWCQVRSLTVSPGLCWRSFGVDWIFFSLVTATSKVSFTHTLYIFLPWIKHVDTHVKWVFWFVRTHRFRLRSECLTDLVRWLKSTGSGCKSY